MENEARKVYPIEAPLIEKLSNLLIYLADRTEFYGQRIEIANSFFSPYQDQIFGSKNSFELGSFFNAIKKFSYIQADGIFKVPDKEGFTVEVPQNLSLTIEGLDYAKELQESGKNSTNCFVAMSFDKKTDKTFSAIKTTLEKNNFKPLRVDKEHIDSERTINDYIIASIKSSRFCIADFTLNRLGVYFEAGYALGRGLKVIYTCQEEHKKDLHFDLRPLQFIIYKTEEELEEALDLKIKSFIID